MSHHVAQVIWQFLIAHQLVIAGALAWNFSAFMSSLPPLDPKAGYWTRTFHDYFQLVSANMNKRQIPPPPPMEALPPAPKTGSV